MFGKLRSFVKNEIQRWEETASKCLSHLNDDIIKTHDS